MRRHLTYANVTATIALVLAIGGTGYAVSEIGSRDLKNNSVRSQDLRNQKAVRARDVVRNELTGRQIKESSLAIRPLAQIAGATEVVCDPEEGVRVDCASTPVRLTTPSDLMVVASGGQVSEGAAARAQCVIRVDDLEEAVQLTPGEAATDNTSSSASNGFARTLVPRDPLSAGRHVVALSCSQLGSADVRIYDPTIAAIAIKTN